MFEDSRCSVLAKYSLFSIYLSSVASDTLISACLYKWKASLRLHRSVAASQIFIISDAGCPPVKARKDTTLRRRIFLRRCEPLMHMQPHPIRDMPAVVWSLNMFEQRSLSCLQFLRFLFFVSAATQHSNLGSDKKRVKKRKAFFMTSKKKHFEQRYVIMQILQW